MKYLLWTLGVIGIAAGSVPDPAGTSLPGLAVAGATLILVATLHACTARIIAHLGSGDVEG